MSRSRLASALSAAMSLMLAAAAASAQVPASALTRIGTAAAVAGAVKAVSSGAAVGRVVSSGKPLFLNDHVTTDGAGRLQVLLLDETIFTLGPNSDMVLDDFVYDPKSGFGKIDAAISKGTFRFVTGKIAQKDPSKLKIKLVVGTIGVRGSIGVGETGPDGSTIINGGARNADNHDDSAGIYVESGGRTVNLPQPGAGTRVFPGGRVADATIMGGELNRIMRTLQTQAGQGAGRGGEPDGADRRTATEASGRATAVGGLLASANEEALALSRLDDTIATNAVQQALASIANGPANWQDLINNLPTGTGSYSNTGTYTCSGGVCGGGSSGSLTMNFDVDFAARQIQSGATLALSGAISDTGTLTAPISYSGATGPAKFTIGAGELSATGNFAGTTGTFNNSGGTTAKNLTMNLQYTNAGATATGSVTGAR